MCHQCAGNKRCTVSASKCTKNRLAVEQNVAQQDFGRGVFAPIATILWSWPGASTPLRAKKQSSSSWLHQPLFLPSPLTHPSLSFPKPSLPHKSNQRVCGRVVRSAANAFLRILDSQNASRGNILVLYVQCKLLCFVDVQ